MLLVGGFHSMTSTPPLPLLFPPTASCILIDSPGVAHKLCWVCGNFSQLEAQHSAGHRELGEKEKETQGAVRRTELKTGRAAS